MDKESMNIIIGALNTIWAFGLFGVTCGLLYVTKQYVECSKKQNKLVEEQMELQTRPYVYINYDLRIEKNQLIVELENCGKSPAYNIIINTTPKILSRLCMWRGAEPEIFKKDILFCRQVKK